MRKSHFGKCVVAFLLVLSAANTGLAAGGWRSTSWVIKCVDVAPDPDAAPDAAPDPNPCAPADDINEELLKKASEWLSRPGLGFSTHGPAVRFLGTSYEAEISDAANNDPDGESSGIYTAGGPLSLKSDTYSAMGDLDEDGENPTFRAGEGVIYTPIHELFHAVQYGIDSKFWEDSANAADWITEGTADAVMISYISRARSDRFAVSESSRTFDFPLHKPEDKDSNYGTWIFWYKLGKELRSPGTIEYIAKILENYSGGDGLKGVDENLPQGGLYKFMPRVFASFDPGNELFGEPSEATFVLRAGQTTIEEEIKKKVSEVAGHGITLKLEEEVEHTVVAEVWLDEKDPDLHLIVDKTLYNEIEGSDRNVYWTVMFESSMTLDIVVANVAPKAIDSKSKNFTLKVRLVEIDPCKPSIMMAAMDDGAPVRDAAEYMNEIAPGGNRSEQNLLMPAVGALAFNGIATARGAACTDPIGTNPVLTAGSQGAALARAQSRASELRRYTETISGLNPSGEVSGRDRASHESASAIKDATDAMAAGNVSGDDTLIQIYSPNAMAWQTGTIPDPLIFDHGGIEGWPPNSAANLVIRIVGVAPKDLEVGKTYRAESVEANAYGVSPEEDVPTLFNTIFTSWSGIKKKPGLPPGMPSEILALMAQGGMMEMISNAFAFEGSTQAVYLRPGAPLTGTVKILAVNAGLVSGRFVLDGSVGKRTTVKAFREERDGRISGDFIVSENDQFGPVTVSGTFMAPAVEQVYRANRPIAYTARVR